MNHLETILSWSTLLFEIALCGFVFARRAQRILPLFSVYVCVSLICTVGGLFTYVYLGFDSKTAYYAFWTSLFLFVTTRSLAIAELCRYGLRNYRGIWALAWRVLAALSVFLVVHAAINAWGQPDGVAIYWASFARDFALASLIVLTVLFLFRNYYELALDRLPRLLAVGICVTCAVDAIGNTILLNSFKGYLFPWFLESQKALWPAMEPLVRRVEDIWSTAHLIAFMLSMGIWGYALRKPLPAPSESPSLLPVSVYREMSSAINAHLATFNDRLTELLKP
jgi:hypothetical protein